ncbi:MAG: translocation/assembly module TamB domain-containing protein [Deltaproteobacteria bacterium]|nr:translocation/assembly module TamB domain-containing protein [Deltaproteobacteria bacterium]
MKPKRSRRLRMLLISMAFLSFMSVSLFTFIQHPRFVEAALAFATRNTPWKAHLNQVSWKPWLSRLEFRGFQIEHRDGLKKITLQKADLGYSILGIFRGKLVLDAPSFEGLRIEIQKTDTAPKTSSSKAFNPKKLFLLQNLVIQNAVIKDVQAAVGEKTNISFDHMTFSFDRSFLGKTTITSEISHFAVSSRDEKQIQWEKLTFQAATKLERWTANAPYLNDVSGKVSLQSLHHRAMDIDHIDAQFALNHGTLAVTPFQLERQQKKLAGEAKANFSDQTFAVTIDIPEAMHIPNVEGPSGTFLTAGEAQGKLTLEGQGFAPLTLQAAGQVDLRYRFTASPDWEHRLQTSVGWKDGVIVFNDATLFSNEAIAHLQGTIDLKKKSIDLSATSDAYPLGAVFENFSDPHLAIISGNTKFSGTFTGWGKNFRTSVTGDVSEAGWDKIRVERVKAQFDASYDRMKLTGTLHQGDRQTGSALLTIAYGTKIPGKKRPMKLVLDANIVDLPLSPSLYDFMKLSGTGSGKIQLTSNTGIIKAVASTHAENGAWFGIPFDTAATTVDIGKKQVVFRDMRFKLANAAEQVFPQTLTLDIEDNGIHLHGTPKPELNLDVRRHKLPATWDIRSITYRNSASPQESLSLSGSIGKDSLRLKASGTADLTWLMYARDLVRSSSGKANIDLSATGNLDQPNVAGRITLQNAALLFRKTPYAFDAINGVIELKNDDILFHNLSAEVNEGKIKIDGSLSHHLMHLGSSQLTLHVTEFPLSIPDQELRLACDANLSLTGDFPSPHLEGDITILDATYAKDFRLLESITKRAKPKKIEIIDFNPSLRLRIVNTGDALIRNNIGEIDLRINATILGTRAKPKMLGTVDVMEGEIRYLGLNFDITKGFMEFRDPYDNPYLEVAAEREVGVYNISLFLQGDTDNLRLDLTANSPSGQLEKRDVISLLMFGVTEKERQLQAGGGQEQFATGIIASQVSGLLTRPVSELTHLDVFRLEAPETLEDADGKTRRNGTSISRVYVGKEINDRLSLDFAMDLGSEDAIQTMIAEYLLTDNLFLKGLRRSTNEYEIRGTLRFESR